MLLDGKRLLITGVLTNASIAFAAAKLAQEQGAEVVLTGFGRGKRLTDRVANRLPDPPDVLELDVTNPEDIQAAVEDIESRWGARDGIVHAVGVAPDRCIGGGFLDAPWEDVSTAVQVSTYSYASLAKAFAPLLAKAGGGSIVGLDFDATVAWPAYDWMGVAKAGLESANRYVARELGPQGTRVNLIAAGPIATIAAKSIDGFKDGISTAWGDLAPLGWDVTDAEPVGRAICALLSDWTPAVTGEIVHVDGGAHAMGLPVR